MACALKFRLPGSIAHLNIPWLSVPRESLADPCPFTEPFHCFAFHVNHSQILALFAMEPPTTMAAEDIRNEKVRICARGAR